MEERDWVILLTLYEKRSITKAARALYISQPALTTRLHHLEQRFGVQIVIRNKYGLDFTPEGSLLVGYSKEMLRKMHVLEGTIRSMKNEVRGTLRIGASNFFTRHKLPELLQQFRKKYPDVDFELITNLSGRIVSAIHDHDVDIAFIRGEYGWSGEKELLFTEQMYAVAAEPFDLSSLPVMTQVDYISNKAVRNLIDDWWETNYTHPPLIGMAVNSVDSCKELVVKGLGYAFLPGTILDENDPLYKILLLDKNEQPLTRRTWMFYNEDILNIVLVKTFIDFVKNLDVYAL